MKLCGLAIQLAFASLALMSACNEDKVTPCEEYCENSCAIIGDCIMEREFYSQQEFEDKFGSNYQSDCVHGCVSTSNHYDVPNATCEAENEIVVSMDCTDVYLTFKVDEILALLE